MSITAEQLSSFMAYGAVPWRDGPRLNVNAQEVLKLIEAYAPGIEVYFVPPENRVDPSYPAYCITHLDYLLRRYPVFYISDESQIHMGKLDQLFRIDNEKRGNLNTEIDVRNARVEHQKNYALQQAAEQRKELMTAVLSSPKDTYTLPDGTKFTS